jgi:hypothetical protein
VLFYFDPRHYHFYPICFFHQTTGLLCPGCGALRATYQLLHGHLAAAFHFNPMLILSLPFLFWYGAKFVQQKARHQALSIGLRPSWLWLILATVLIVSVLRNLPGAPFAMLRPQGCIKPPSSIRHSGGLNDYSGHSLAPGISSADA